MTLEIDVKFNVGDKVIVTDSHSGYSWEKDAFTAVVSGYVIHKGKKNTRIYYTVEELRSNGTTCDVRTTTHKRRYTASELEPLVETN